jgi:hypothetical protein
MQSPSHPAIMRATEKDLQSIKKSKGLHSEVAAKLWALYVESDLAGESGNRLLLGLISSKDQNTLTPNITDFSRSVTQCESTWRQLGHLQPEYDGAVALLAKFKVNPEYHRHAHLPEALVSTKRGAQTLAQLVAARTPVQPTGPATTTTTKKMTMPPPIKRQKQHINPETNQGYCSPFSPWYYGPKTKGSLDTLKQELNSSETSCDN